MKRFEFGLEKVRRWRHEQVDMEDAKLGQLHSELDALKLECKRLETEGQTAQQVLRAGASISASDLQHLDAFKQFVRTRSQKLEEQGRECQRRIAQQRQRLIEALRQAELLDRLKSQKLTDWRSKYQKQEEEMAAELFLAKRKRHDL